MSNSFFHFKQFSIHQDKCAMKVCTDACVLGAWSANKLQDIPSVKQILDIGCGTGLLSLMLAQTSAASIDAIEINENAFQQAKDNILQSPWHQQIEVINTALQQFTPAKKYDFIISNPPFFEDDLKSADENKNTSKHDTGLKLEELVLFLSNHLNENGFAYILIPFHRTEYFATLVKKYSLFIKETIFIKQSTQHSYFRSIILVSLTAYQPIESNELTIHDSERNYTEEFKTLLKPYYLKL